MGGIVVEITCPHQQVFRVWGFQDQNAARLECPKRFIQHPDQVIEKQVLRHMQCRDQVQLCRGQGFQMVE